MTVEKVTDGDKNNVPEQPVYNLTIAGEHQFYANGLLTHNCDSLRYAVFSTRWEWSRILNRELEPNR